MELWVNRDVNFNLYNVVCSTLFRVCNYINHPDITRKWTGNYWNFTATVLALTRHGFTLDLHCPSGLVYTVIQKWPNTSFPILLRTIFSTTVYTGPHVDTRFQPLNTFTSLLSSVLFWVIFRNPQSRFTPSLLVLARATTSKFTFNPLNSELNPICYLLALWGAHHFLHVSRIRVKSLTFRRLMSYIYEAPILDVSRSHTTTQHSR